MPKLQRAIPAVVPIVCWSLVALWWVLLVSWQPGVVRFIEQLAYRFEPPTLTMSVIARATDRAMQYVTTGPATIQADIFFTKAEVSHLADVALVLKSVRLLVGVGALCSWIILIGMMLSSQHYTRRVWWGARNVMLVWTGASLLALTIFSPFFVALHILLFPQGNWQFPDSSLLIQIFPEIFWRLLVGWVCLGALLCTLLFHILGALAHDEPEA